MVSYVPRGGWGSGTGLRAAVHKALLHVTDLYVDPCIEVDGVVETTASTPNGFHPVSALAVVQTEFGTAKTDPAAEAECVYVAIYSSVEVRLFAFAFPAVDRDPPKS